MHNRISRKPEALRIRRRRIAGSAFSISLLGYLLVGGCGAPAEPTPPVPAIPARVTDLAAQQAGEAVQLTFTLPGKTISGERLAEAPATEIFRGSVRPDGSPDTKSFRVIDTIPGALIGEYRSADKVQIVDRISADDLRAYPGGLVAYRVRTRASRKRASADSNTATVRIRPVPERVTSLHANVTEFAIELSWSAPAHASTGEPLPTISEYRIYRGEIDSASADAAAKDLAQVKWKSPLTFLASTPTTSYRDTSFDFGKAYVYTVRTVIPADGSTIESGDSAPAVVTPSDTYPPAVPQGLVAAVVTPDANGPPEVDLSWSINTETDLAGYRVYRSEQEGTKGQLVTPDLLPSPAYRDTSVQPGHSYWYSVTAVDRAGNESAPSAPVAAEIAQPFF
jgi:hypothetical protein